MKKKLIYSILVLFLGSAIFLACPNNKKAESEKGATEKIADKTAEKKTATPEKGAIEKMTDKAAKEALDRIRTPIEKARSAQKQGEDRLSDIEKALKE